MLLPRSTVVSLSYFGELCPSWRKNGMCLLETWHCLLSSDGILLVRLWTMERCLRVQRKDGRLSMVRSFIAMYWLSLVCHRAFKSATCWTVIRNLSLVHRTFTGVRVHDSNHQDFAERPRVNSNRRKFAFEVCMLDCSDTCKYSRFCCHVCPVSNYFFAFRLADDISACHCTVAVSHLCVLTKRPRLHPASLGVLIARQ